MTENVVSLTGGAIAAPEPVPQIIAMLERALEQARGGNIAALAIVKVRTSDRCFDENFHAEVGARGSLACGILALSHHMGATLQAP